MSAELLDRVTAAAGGHALWRRVRRLRVDIAIGGPIWARKGWAQGQVFDQMLTIDPARQHIVSTPFTRPDQRMVFDAATDTVSIQTLDGDPIETLHPTRPSFKGMQRFSHWNALQLGYFMGYACWNYFTTPFLFSYPDVVVEEIEPWRETRQTWRRLLVTFPPSIVSHSREQVFYFDERNLQRRMDYIAEVNGNTPVSHFCEDYREFQGLHVATRRRVYPRNPDGTVNFNMNSITLDIRDVDVDLAPEA